MLMMPDQVPSHEPPRETTQDPVIMGLTGAGHKSLPCRRIARRVRLTSPMAYQAPRFNARGICSRAGRRRHGDEDDGGRVRGTQDVECGGTVRPELDVPPLRGISKDLGFKCIDE